MSGSSSPMGTGLTSYCFVADIRNQLGSQVRRASSHLNHGRLPSVQLDQAMRKCSSSRLPNKPMAAMVLQSFGIASIRQPPVPVGRAKEDAKHFENVRPYR